MTDSRSTQQPLVNVHQSENSARSTQQSLANVHQSTNSARSTQQAITNVHQSTNSARSTQQFISVVFKFGTVDTPRPRNGLGQGWRKKIWRAQNYQRGRL